MIRRFLTAALAGSILIPTIALADVSLNSSSHVGVSLTAGSSSSANAAALSCVRTAVLKREDATFTAFHAFDVSIEAALKTRRTKLDAAWQIQVKKDREAAINTAWKDYRTARKTASATFRTADKGAWKVFKDERKTCKPPKGSVNFGAEEKEESTIQIGL